MGKCSSVIREIRFVIEEELTQVYIHVDAFGDCPLGVQGWHHKTFAGSKAVDEILPETADFLLWPLKAPE